MKHLLFGVLIVFAVSNCKESAPTVPTNPGNTTPPDTTIPDTPPSATDNNLESLPKDTGGNHKANALGSDASPYGYYLYTPSGYTSNGPRFPLMIFLHGAGEVGNSKTDAKALDKILVNGPPKLVKNKTWAPKYPMVVASIQCHDGWWDTQKVKQFTEFMMKNYRVDTTRIYMTGLSMGGFGTWDQITIYGKGSHITAAVPICGSGVIPISDARVKRAAAIPVWAFHGADDKTVLPDFDILIHAAINKLDPTVPEKLTIYPATGHDSWSKTYTRTGTAVVDPKYDPFAMDIYTWLLQYKK